MTNAPQQPSRPSRVSPIEKFLGPEALSFGPLGLLALTPETCTDDQIVSSLEWQLDRVSQHPEGDTPEADEVRLALHAAAAQLLDRNVRRHVLERLASGAGPAPNTATSLEQDAILTLAMYGGWNKHSLQRLGALAHARGMSSEALAESLQHLATKRRKPKPAAQSARPAPARAAGVRTSATGGDVDPVAQDPAASQQDHTAVYLRNIVIGVAVVFLVLTTSFFYVGWLLTGGGGSGSGATQTTPPGAPNTQAAAPSPNPATAPAPQAGKFTPPAAASTPSQSTTVAKPAAPRKPSPAKPAGAYVDPLLVVRALRESATLVKTDAGAALKSFSEALASLTSRWCRFDPAQRRAADSAVVDFIYASAAHPEVGSAAFDAIARGAGLLRAPGAGAEPAAASGVAREDVWPVVWSVGLLTRLSRERELPSDISGKVETSLTAAIGADRPRMQATFETGAVPALRSLPARILRAAGDDAPAESSSPDAGPLSEWIEAVVSVTGPDQDARERLLSDGLEQLLVEAAEPTADKHVHAAIHQLVLEIKWRKGGAARARLLAWFKDKRVSSGDLQVLTASLANQSSAEGVDPMMVLSIGASTGDRERLRGTYVKAWGESGSGMGSEVPANWANAARQELALSGAYANPIDFLEAAVRCAELNDAATRLWRGETHTAASMLEALGEAASDAKEKAAVSAATSIDSTYEGDGRWLAAYLSVGRNIPLRLERLKTLGESKDPLGPADAEFLVEIACNESPAEVRSAAQRVVQIHSESPLIVNGMLEVLPRAPRYPTVSAMFEKALLRTLPNPADPSWELEARRALVERLLELLASSGEQSAVNVLAALLWESYRVRSGGAPMRDEDVLPVGEARAGSDAAAAMWAFWRQAADAVSPNEYAPVSIDHIDRRREGRLALAGGSIQEFAANQSGVAELMAYVVTAEKPASAAASRAVIEDLSAQRRKASHIFEQLALAERAMLRLWLVRFEEAEQ